MTTKYFSKIILMMFSLALIITGLVVPSTSASALTQQESITTWKSQIYTNTNSYRTSNKLNKLQGSIHLNKIAQDWANYMANTGDYRHNPNVEKQTRTTAGWTWAGGENIAYGFADGNAVSKGWWESPGHKANILFNGYNRIGIGVAFSKSGTPYYVQVFAHNTGADKTMDYNQLPPDPKSPFLDVRSSDKFYKEIKWMHATGLSTGTKTSQGYLYKPKDSVTREALAAFLFRSSKAKFTPPKVSPFIDMKPTDKFYKEITWMHATGLSTGTKTSKGYVYKPKDSVTREAVAAFLSRANKTQFTPPKVSPFSDVKPTDKFYKEIAWMKANGITTTTKFNPKSPITREALAAFLYRDANK